MELLRFTVKRAFSINQNGEKVFDIPAEEIDGIVTKQKAAGGDW